MNRLDCLVCEHDLRVLSVPTKAIVLKWDDARSRRGSQPMTTRNKPAPSARDRSLSEAAASIGLKTYLAVYGPEPLRAEHPQSVQQVVGNWNDDPANHQRDPKWPMERL